MTDRIAEIEERLKIAMPSPWLRESSKPHSIFASDGEFVCGVVRNCDHDSLPLIQNAPTDIAYLLSEVKSKSAECERLRGLLREMKQRAYFSTGNGYETIEDTLQNIDADPADYSPEVIDLQSRVLAELEPK